MFGRMCPRATLTVSALACAICVALPGSAYALKGGPPGAPPGQTTHTTAAPGKGTPPQGKQSVKGVLQSFTQRAVVLRQLDGTVVTVLINRHTLLVVNGKPGRLAQVKPGFVVLVSRNGHGPASELRFLRSG
jgi:hypothetical protein